MTWLRKDDRFPEHRKIRRLADGAYRLHDTAMCFTAKDEADGMITPADIEEMTHGKRLRRHIPSLVEANLWEPVKGGWIIHDFLDYNPSHVQQEAKRAAQRERQEKFRQKRQEDSHAVTNALVTRESHAPVPTRPDPSRPVPFLGVLRAVEDAQDQSSSSPDVSRGAGR